MSFHNRSKGSYTPRVHDGEHSSSEQYRGSPGDNSRDARYSSSQSSSSSPRHHGYSHNNNNNYQTPFRGVDHSPSSSSSSNYRQGSPSTKPTSYKPSPSSRHSSSSSERRGHPKGQSEPFVDSAPQRVDNMLSNEWTFWRYDPPKGRPRAGEYKLDHVGNVNSISSFWHYFHQLPPPSKLSKDSSINFFKKGIQPMWEDPQNKYGGKWVLTFKNREDMLDKYWCWILLSLIGELLDIDDDICGAVVSRKRDYDRISIWTRKGIKTHLASNLGIAKRLLQIVQLDDFTNITLDFNLHGESIKTGSSYHSVSALLELNNVKDALADPTIPNYASNIS